VVAGERRPCSTTKNDLPIAPNTPNAFNLIGGVANQSKPENARSSLAPPRRGRPRAAGSEPSIASSAGSSAFLIMDNPPLDIQRLVSAALPPSHFQTIE
jgi:hypothetical protein